MKKKVIFVAQALWLGGIETALVNLLNHLDYDKFDITCLITEDYRDMADRIDPRCRLLVADRGHRVSLPEPYRFARLYNLMEEPQRATAMRRMIWKMLRFMLRGPEMALYARYIREQMKAERFDTAVIYSDRTAEIAVRAIDAKQFLMFYHNADLGRAYHDRYGYRASEKIIAVSPSQCEKLKKLRPQFAGKMIDIPNYVDVDTTRAKAAEPVDEPSLVEPGIHLVSCGRLAPQKGFDIAVEACAKLVERGFDNLRWHILGVGAMEGQLREKIRELGMEAHFLLEGSRKNPFPWMRAADVYVQPSRSEGYSLSILEARVLACPVVATWAAAGEQLENGVTGSLCEPTADSIADAVENLLRNPEISLRYREELGEYSFEKANAEIIDKIQSLLQKGV